MISVINFLHFCLIAVVYVSLFIALYIAACIESDDVLLGAT